MVFQSDNPARLIHNTVGVAPVSLTPRCRAANTHPVGVTGVAIHIARDSVCQSMNILPVLTRSRASALLQMKKYSKSNSCSLFDRSRACPRYRHRWLSGKSPKPCRGQARLPQSLCKSTDTAGQTETPPRRHSGLKLLVCWRRRQKVYQALNDDPARRSAHCRIRAGRSATVRGQNHFSSRHQSLPLGRCRCSR